MEALTNNGLKRENEKVQILEVYPQTICYFTALTGDNLRYTHLKTGNNTLQRDMSRYNWMIEV